MSFLPRGKMIADLMRWLGINPAFHHVWSLPSDPDGSSLLIEASEQHLRIEVSHERRYVRHQVVFLTPKQENEMLIALLDRRRAKDGWKK